MILTNVAYRISPARWEEPRCYWRADGLDEKVRLRALEDGWKSESEWTFNHVSDDLYTIQCGANYVGLDGLKLVLRTSIDKAQQFRLHQVGSYVVFSRSFHTCTCLIECENGNLGNSTDIQVWEGSVPTAWSSLDKIPEIEFRHLWKLDQVGTDPKAWMSNLPSAARLHEIAICGTHDTCTWHITRAAAIAAGALTGAAAGSVVPLVGTVFGALIGAMIGGGIAQTSMTQWLPLDQQLNAGIRYLDIRLCEDLQIYHGAIPTGVSFAEVLQVISDFLQQPASRQETIVMQIKREGPSEALSDGQYRDKVNAEIDNASHGVRWYTKNEIPQLDDVRGQVVLVRRYADDAANPRGIDLHAWSPEFNPRATVGNVSVKIQDCYTLKTSSEKEVQIAKMLSDMAMAPDATWYINFTSDAGGLLPLSYASEINPWLGTQLNFQTRMRGVFMTDYPSPELIDRIIRLNSRPDVATSWQAVTVSSNSGWTVTEPCGYMKDSSGFVHLQGAASYTGQETVRPHVGNPVAVFRLPDAYRPAASQSFTDNQIYVDAQSRFVSGIASAIRLDGISFRAMG